MGQNVLSKQHKLLGLVLGVVILGAIGLIAYPFRASGEEVVIHTKTGAHKFQVEIAKTPDSRAKGLMHRDYLGANRGMLFLYPNQRSVTMWMKNTLISLDMLFVSTDGRIVRVARNAQPHSQTLIPSIEPIIAVLEIRGGEAEAIQVKAGDRLEASISLESARQ